MEGHTTLNERDFDENCIALRVLGRLALGDRLCTTQTEISVHKWSFFDWGFARSFLQQSRNANIVNVGIRLLRVFTYVEALLAFFDNCEIEQRNRIHIKRCQELHTLLSLLPQAAEGLEILKTTYSGDEGCRGKIEQQSLSITNLVNRAHQSLSQAAKDAIEIAVNPPEEEDVVGEEEEEEDDDDVYSAEGFHSDIN